MNAQHVLLIIKPIICIQVEKLQYWGRRFQTPWLHNSAWFNATVSRITIVCHLFCTMLILLCFELDTNPGREGGREGGGEGGGEYL